MGKIVTIEYVDDLDGIPVDAESVDTVEFSYRGQDFSLVLTAKNGAQFDKDIARYIRAAKKAQTRDAHASRQKAKPASRRTTKAKVKTAPRRTATSRPAVAPALDGPERARAIREWATANGHSVSQRGRISSTIIEAYDAAH